MLIRKRKDIPSNNILTLLVETFKCVSRRHILFYCPIMIASLSSATFSLYHLKILQPRTMPLVICFEEKNKIQQLKNLNNHS